MDLMLAGLAHLLVAVGLHARSSSSSSLCVLLGEDGLLVSLVEDALDDLLLIGAENLGQALVQLGLLGLKVYRKGVISESHFIRRW